MSSRPPPIHVWVPGIGVGSGGIQAFSRTYLRALRNAYPHLPLRVFVKNDDPPADDPLRSLGIQFHSVASYPPLLRTAALTLKGWFFGWRERPCAAVATHLHFLPALWLMRFATGVRCGAVLHGIEAWHIQSRLRFLALRSADHLMAVSEFTRNFVISRLGVAPQRVSVVPNTFDTERFHPGPKPDYLMQRYGFKPGQPILMTVSRLALSERYKGHRQVMGALPEIRKHFPDIRYLIVGTGDDAQGLQNAAYARNLEDCVVMAGHISDHELPDHYRLCDVFVMPSSKEGFGIVFLEAMASGKPVVAGCIDGSVDAVAGGRLSPMVDPNDVTKIGEVILRILRREPADALWLQPEALSAAVKAEFGFPRISRLIAQDLTALVEQERLCGPWQRPRPPAEGELPSAPRLLIIVRAINRERVRFFNALSAHGGFNLEVVYLTHGPECYQASGEIAYNRVILSKALSLTPELRLAVRNADLVIFGSHVGALARQALQERTASKQPCVLWLGMGDLQPQGLMEVGRKWLKRDPLHLYAPPLWTTSGACQRSLQKKFGGSRSYRFVPVPVRSKTIHDTGDPHSPQGELLEDCIHLFRSAVEDTLSNWRARSPTNGSQPSWGA